MIVSDDLLPNLYRLLSKSVRLLSQPRRALSPLFDYIIVPFHPQAPCQQRKSRTRFLSNPSATLPSQLLPLLPTLPPYTVHTVPEKSAHAQPESRRASAAQGPDARRWEVGTSLQVLLLHERLSEMIRRNKDSQAEKEGARGEKGAAKDYSPPNLKTTRRGLNTNAPDSREYIKTHSGGTTPCLTHHCSTSPSVTSAAFARISASSSHVSSVCIDRSRSACNDTSAPSSSAASSSLAVAASCAPASLRTQTSVSSGSTVCGRWASSASYQSYRSRYVSSRRRAADGGAGIGGDRGWRGGEAMAASISARPKVMSGGDGGASCLPWRPCAAAGGAGIGGDLGWRGGETVAASMSSRPKVISSADDGHVDGVVVEEWRPPWLLCAASGDDGHGDGVVESWRPWFLCALSGRLLLLCAFAAAAALLAAAIRKGVLAVVVLVLILVVVSAERLESDRGAGVGVAGLPTKPPI
ncbi:hypothetical protein HDK77DRAFT_201410 [Phyllosticta capitalensis]